MRACREVRSEKFQKTLRAASSDDKDAWFKLIETSARKIVADLRSKVLNIDAQNDISGEAS